MRRYMWIIVSLVLPLAFIIVMRMRPPQSPGIEVRVPPAGAVADRASVAVEQVAAPDAGVPADGGGEGRQGG